MKTTTTIRKRIDNTIYVYRTGRLSDGWGCLACETWYPHQAKVKRTFVLLLLHKLLIHGQIGAASVGKRTQVVTATIAEDAIRPDDWPDDAHPDAGPPISAWSPQHHELFDDNKPE